MGKKENQQVWSISSLIREQDQGAISAAKKNIIEVLPQEFNKDVSKKFRRRKVYSEVKYNIWAAVSVACIFIF